MIEENVVSAAGTTYRASTEEFVHLIKRLGKIPVQRDTLYRAGQGLELTRHWLSSPIVRV